MRLKEAILYNTRGTDLSQLTRHLPALMKDFYINNVVSKLGTLHPTVMQFNVTHRCNARCAICNIWKTRVSGEPDLDRWEDVFSDKIFETIEYLLISGGEPTLRGDLFEIVRSLTGRVPSLRKILIAINGIERKRASELLPSIIELCNGKNIQVTVTVSLDGVGEVQDDMRGMPKAFERTLETIHYLKKLREKNIFRLNIGATICNINVYGLEDLAEFCRKEDLPVIFYKAWLSDTYYKNLEQKKYIDLNDDMRRDLIGFLRKRIAEDSRLNGDAYYYSKVIEMLQGKRRNIPCPFVDQGFVLDANGDIYYCNNSKKIGNAFEDSAEHIYFAGENLSYRKYLIKNVCPNCESSCLVGVSLEKKILPYLVFLLNKL